MTTTPSHRPRAPDGAAPTAPPPDAEWVLTRAHIWLCDELAAALTDHASAKAACEAARNAFENQGAGDIEQAKERARLADELHRAERIAEHRDGVVSFVVDRLFGRIILSLEDRPWDTAEGAMARLEALATAATAVAARLDTTVPAEYDPWIASMFSPYPVHAPHPDLGIDTKALLEAAVQGGRAAPEPVREPVTRDAIIATTKRLGNAAQPIVHAFTDTDVFSRMMEWELENLLNPITTGDARLQLFAARLAALEAGEPPPAELVEAPLPPD